MYNSGNEEAIFIILVFLLSIVYIFVILPLPARIARKKGHSFIGFLIFGLIFYPLALVVSLLIGDKKQAKLQTENDKAEALVNYKKLLDEGVITQEEFDKKKKECLN